MQHVANSDEIAQLNAEIERLRGLKTPASRQLVDISKALLDDANGEIERLRRALQQIDDAVSIRSDVLREMARAALRTPASHPA
jgi:hypothetical protein